MVCSKNCFGDTWLTKVRSPLTRPTAPAVERNLQVSPQFPLESVGRRAWTGQTSGASEPGHQQAAFCSRLVGVD